MSSSSALVLCRIEAWGDVDASSKAPHGKMRWMCRRTVWDRREWFMGTSSSGVEVLRRRHGSGHQGHLEHGLASCVMESLEIVSLYYASAYGIWLDEAEGRRTWLDARSPYP